MSVADNRVPHIALQERCAINSEDREFVVQDMVNRTNNEVELSSTSPNLFLNIPGTVSDEGEKIRSHFAQCLELLKTLKIRDPSLAHTIADEIVGSIREFVNIHLRSQTSNPNPAHDGSLNPFSHLPAPFPETIKNGWVEDIALSTQSASFQKPSPNPDSNPFDLL
jgi:hypothetical protein